MNLVTSSPAEPNNVPGDHKLTYTVTEAARAISIGRSKFYDLLAAGDVESVRIGSRRVVRREALVKFLDGLAGSAA